MARMSTVREKAEQAAQRANEMVEKGRQMAMERAEGLPEKMKNPFWGIPSFYIGFTAASLIASIVLFSQKQKENAIFVGLWPPTILAMGIFHKVVVDLAKESVEENKE